MLKNKHKIFNNIIVKIKIKMPKKVINSFFYYNIQYYSSI